MSVVCAIIVEPVQGEGGIYPATLEFLAGLRELCDRSRVLIFDEVQCGVGRTGFLGVPALWRRAGHPHLAKPLAGGLPIGAILVRQAVADVMQKGDHGSTFAGGPFVTHVAHHPSLRAHRPA